MTELTTTFALLRQHEACARGYETLARHLGGVTTYGSGTPIPLLAIMESNGLDDTLWALRAVPEEQGTERDRLARLLAADYAEHVLPCWTAIYPDDRRVGDCIAVARQYAAGEATDAELTAARAAAWAAGAAGAARAAGAAGAARAALAAAWAAAGDAGAAGAARAAERKWQAARLRAILATNVMA